jgi:hypothetical protein
LIGNVIRGNGMRGLLDYISGKDDAFLLSTNLVGETPRDFARQFGDVRGLYPRDTVKDPVVHLPLRPAPGEDLSDDQWRNVVENALHRLGFQDAPYVAYLHHHEDGRHLHIATYRCDFNGRLVSDSNDRYRMAALTAEISRLYGLTHAPLREDGRGLTRAELQRQLANPNRAAAKEALRRVLDEAASRHDTVRGFLSELHRQGVNVDLKIAKNTGQVQGISLTLPDGSRIKGSDLGKKYSFAALLSRHDLRDNLKPETPYLELKGVTAAEWDALHKEGLAPDSVERQGSRYVLAWELPWDAERPFADLIANRLPHRFISFPDEIPAPPAHPNVLRERHAIVQLAQELRQTPSAAPPTEALTREAAHPPVNRPPHLPATVAELTEISAALAPSDRTPGGSTPFLRERYNQLLRATVEACTHAYTPISGPENGFAALAAFGERSPNPPPSQPPETLATAERPDFRVFMHTCADSLAALRQGVVPEVPVTRETVALAAYLANPSVANYQAFFRDSARRSSHAQEFEEASAQSAASLRNAEATFLNAPTPTNATAWREAATAHNYYAAISNANQARDLQDQRHSRSPSQEQRSERLPEATRQWGRIFEAEILGRGRLADRLALKVARRAWAKTPMGRAANKILHPVRATLRSVPGGAVLLATVDAAAATTRALRRSYAIYLEVRAAQDAYRRVHPAANSLLEGNFSNRALAEELAKHPRIPLAPAPTPDTLGQAIRQSRSAEAQLLRTYRSHSRGIADAPSLHAAAGNALQARAAVTAKLVEGIGAPPLSRLTASLGAVDGRALSALIGSLQSAGLSTRAITAAVMEAAPLIGVQLGAAIAAAAARRAVQTTLNYFRNQTKATLEAQNEQRQ